MKYFFLSNNWTTGRIWEFGGLWNEQAWQRSPHIQQQSLCIEEKGDTLRLYEAEDAVLMVEVIPKATTQPTIGQVVLKRLLTAEQVIERLCTEKNIFQGTETSLEGPNKHHSDHRKNQADTQTGKHASEDTATAEVTQNEQKAQHSQVTIEPLPIEPSAPVNQEPIAINTIE